MASPGAGAGIRLGETRRLILAHLREAGPATPKAIAEALEIDYENVKKTCQRMAHDDQLQTDGSGVYSYPSPLSPVSLGGQERHEGHALGGEMFPVLLANAVRHGHVTERKPRTATRSTSSLPMDRASPRTARRQEAPGRARRHPRRRREADAPATARRLRGRAEGLRPPAGRRRTH